MKTCYFCKGPVQPARVEYMARSGGRYFLLKDLPAEQCRQCGEIYLDAGASRQVDHVFSETAVPSERMEVPVFRCD